MQIVPLSPVPAQNVSVLLDGQAATIAVYQKSTGLYFDLSLANVALRNAILCLSGVVLVRDAYLGFTGDLAFYDSLNAADPDWTGLGGRFVLVYLEAVDLLSYGLT